MIRRAEAGPNPKNLEPTYGIVVDSRRVIWQSDAVTKRAREQDWSIERWLLACCVGAIVMWTTPSFAESAAAPSSSTAPSSTAQSNVPVDDHWCAPGLTRLSDRLCYYDGAGAPTQADAGTLVIFLHSLIGAAPRAAWEQQLRMQRMADSHHFAMLVPRGRPGLGPGRDPTVLAWPTAQELQVQFEDELLAEWQGGVKQAVARRGAFARVLLVGFSNGAYYATSLAFRERFTCDGVAVFAGGSGGKYQRLTASRAKRRVPMFVGYGTLDPDNPRQRSLIALLKALGWPHRAVAARVGHTVAGEQLRAALKFLGHPAAP